MAHCFIHERSGETIREDGRREYPDLIQVSVDRRTAIRWLAQIANTLLYPDDEQPITFAVFGELEVIEDDVYGRAWTKAREVE